MSAAKKKRSLADDIADLFVGLAPKTDIDVEDEFAFGAGGQARIDAGEEVEDVSVQRPSRRASEKGLRLRASIDLDAPEYAGRRVSRSEWEGDLGNRNGRRGGGEDGEDAGEEPSGDDDEEDSEGPSGRISSGDDGEEEEEEEEDEDEGETRGRRGTGGHDWDGAPPSKKRARARRGSTGEAGDDDELADLEAELQRVRASEAEAVAALQERASQDRARGWSVRAQRGLWEKSLEMRILLQKGVAAGARVPGPRFAAFAAQQSGEVAEALQGAAAAARDALEALVELRAALSELTPEVAEMASSGGVRLGAATPPAGGFQGAPAEALWGSVEGGFARLRPFVEGSFDKWHARSTAGSGGAGARGGLRSLNQSVSQQVAAAISDPARASRRAAAPLSGVPRRLVEPASASAATEADETDPRDPEVFDDTEFYALLLKEFLETGSDGAAAGAAAAAGERKKVRKVVDRRASKGRKIRYHTMQKLVNFMAPRALELPPMAEQLLGRLFGAPVQALE